MTPKETADMLANRTSHTEEDVETLCKVFEAMSAEDMSTMMLVEIRDLLPKQTAEQKQNMTTLNYTLAKRKEFSDAMARFHKYNDEKKAAAAATPKETP